MIYKRSDRRISVVKIRAAVLSLFCALLLCACAGPELYTLRDRAIEKFDEGSYAEARTLFDEALSYGRGEVSEAEFDILRYRAECELRLKDYEAAENTYAVLLELDPSEQNKELYYDLAAQLDRVKEINEAFEVMAAGDYRAAYDAMSLYASLGGDSTEAMAWYNKAVCAEYLGRWDEARELMEEYLKVFPDDEEAKKEYNFLKTR